MPFEIPGGARKRYGQYSDFVRRKEAAVDEWPPIPWGLITFGG